MVVRIRLVLPDALLFFAQLSCLWLLASPTRSEINGVIKMKVISEPLSVSNYVSHSANNQDDDDDDEKLSVLSPFVPPANFTGPEHFRGLNGSCYTLQKANFEYKICPFQNVTQKETSYSVGRSKFHGILGMWHDWIVEDDRFTGWRFLNGDDCGRKGLRQTTVQFECGNNNLLWEVAEPEQCHYTMTFKLPQACFPDAALLVYPVLDLKSRTAWDQLEGERVQGELTQQGYEKYLRVLLTTAGIVRVNKFLLSTTTTAAETSAPKLTAGDSTVANDTDTRQFSGLDRCQEAYEEASERLRQAELNCRSAVASFR